MSQQQLALVQNNQQENSGLSLYPSTNELKTLTEIASIVVRSGLAPKDVNTPEKALTIILKARELQIPPMAALSNISVFGGKPVMSADLMLGIAKRAGCKIWVVERSDQKCVMHGHTANDPKHIVSCTFSIEDAKRAGLTAKDTWQKYPTALLYARCASAIARMLAPGELAGIYQPEELGNDVEVGEDGSTEIVSSTAKIVELPHREEQQVQPPINQRQFIDKLAEMFDGLSPQEVAKLMGIESFSAEVKKRYPNAETKFYYTLGLEIAQDWLDKQQQGSTTTAEIEIVEPEEAPF